MKFSLCGQYWIKDDSFETLKPLSVLLTQESMQHVLKYEKLQNVVYDYIRLQYLLNIYFIMLVIKK